MIGSVRASAGRLDDRVSESSAGETRTAPPIYGGIVTRAIALATDAALTLVLPLVVAGIAALIRIIGWRPAPGSSSRRPARLWLVADRGCLSSSSGDSAGQTPGMRLLHVRVRGPHGDTPSIGRSLVRLVGLVLAIVPMFAGFIPVLFTERRRGLPDFLAGTVVLYDDTLSQ